MICYRKFIEVFRSLFVFVLCSSEITEASFVSSLDSVVSNVKHSNAAVLLLPKRESNIL